MGIYAQTPVFQVYMSSTELIFLEKYSKYFSKHFLLENGCLITKTPRQYRELFFGALFYTKVLI